jgi:hypothetical protein
MKYQKGDLVDLPLGYGYAVFMRYDEYFNRAYFYSLSANRQDWEDAHFFEAHAKLIG